MHCNLIHQDQSCLRGISDLLLLSNIIHYMKFALKKMHFAKNLKLFVSLSCPVCGFWQRPCYFCPATLCSLPKHTSNLPFFFFQYNESSCVKDFSDFVLIKRKLQITSCLWLRLCAQRSGNLMQVSRPTWSLLRGKIRDETVQICCAYWPHFSDNSSTLCFYWLPLFYCLVFIKCLETQEIS